MNGWMKNNCVKKANGKLKYISFIQFAISLIKYELIITRKDSKITLSPWMGNKEDILDVTDDVDFNWNGFYEKMEQRYRKFEDSIKFDVNDQIKFRFAKFIDYCWNCK